MSPQSTPTKKSSANEMSIGLGEHHGNLYTTPTKSPIKYSTPSPIGSTPPVTPHYAQRSSSLGRDEDDLDTANRLTNFKRPRQSSSSSPTNPERKRASARTVEDEMTSPLNNDLSSSQSDSTYRPSSDISNCENESQRSSGDRNEPSVSRAISCLLEVTCLEPKRSDGYQFSVELDSKALLIPICGAFHAQPLTSAYGSK